MRCAAMSRSALDAMLGKYFRTAIEAHAVFAREAHLIARRFVAACRARHRGQQRRGGDAIITWPSTRPPSVWPSSCGATSAGCAIITARRATRRPSGRRWRSPSFSPRSTKRTTTRPGTTRGASGGAAPVVIAEMSTELPQLTVGEAVMRMDLADAPVLLFRNRSHGELNLVYRRGDGNIGWIDPGSNASGGKA